MNARPIPVSAMRAAQAAITENCDVIVVDVAGPDTFVLRPSMVWALAQGREWPPGHEDPFVAESVGRASWSRNSSSTMTSSKVSRLVRACSAYV